MGPDHHSVFICTPDLSASYLRDVPRRKTADAVPDAAFTTDRAQLPARLRGAGISFISIRRLYLNMLTTVLTQLID
jgi:hypothetical protein